MNLKFSAFLAFSSIVFGQAPIATIPLKLNDTHQYWIEARINGSAPMSCQVDSGGGNRMNLDRERASKMGIEATETGRSGSPQDAKMRTDGRAGVNLEVAGIQFAGTRAILTPIKDPDYSCVIGQTVFHEYIVEIDYQTPALRLYDRRSFHYSGPGQGVAFTIDAGNPFVTATLTMPNGKTFQPRVAVDTGGGSALLIVTKSYVESNDLLHQGITATPDWHWGYAEGRAKVSTAQIEKLAVGPFDIARPVIHLWQAPGFGGSNGPDGLLCGDFLSHFKLIFDYGAGMLILEPTPR
jgi:hypothetical protein